LMLINKTQHQHSTSCGSLKRFSVAVYCYDILLNKERICQSSNKFQFRV